MIATKNFYSFTSNTSVLSKQLRISKPSFVFLLFFAGTCITNCSEDISLSDGEQVTAISISNLPSDHTLELKAIELNQTNSTQEKNIKTFVAKSDFDSDFPRDTEWIFVGTLKNKKGEAVATNDTQLADKAKLSFCPQEKTKMNAAKIDVELTLCSLDRESPVVVGKSTETKIVLKRVSPTKNPEKDPKGSTKNQIVHLKSSSNNYILATSLSLEKSKPSDVCPLKNGTNLTLSEMNTVGNFTEGVLVEEVTCLPEFNDGKTKITKTATSFKKAVKIRIPSAFIEKTSDQKSI